MKTKHILMALGAAALIGGIILYNKNKNKPTVRPFEPAKKTPEPEQNSEFYGNNLRPSNNDRKPIYGCKDGTVVSNPRDCANHGGAEWVNTKK